MDEHRCRQLDGVDRPTRLLLREILQSCLPSIFQAVTMFEKSRRYRPLLGDNEDQSDTDEPTTVNVRRLKRSFWPWKLAPAVHSLVTIVLLIVVAIGVYREKKLFHSRCVRELHTPCRFS